MHITINLQKEVSDAAYSSKDNIAETRQCSVTTAHNWSSA